MKRTKEVSIVIEHRKIAFILTGAVDTALHPSAGAGPDEAGLQPAQSPPVCPKCGAHWIAVNALEGELAISGANAIHRALQLHGLHMHLSPAGQLSICSKSFEGIEETRIGTARESR